LRPLLKPFSAVSDTRAVSRFVAVSSDRKREARDFNISPQNFFVLSRRVIFRLSKHARLH
jgi:hypothetical protein